MGPSLFQFQNRGRSLNLIGLLAICAALLVGLYYQLFRYEVPCPLCLLQRAGLTMVGLALLMNIRFGEQARYYGMALLAALCSAAISARQVLLHVIPGSGSYGSSLLGLHLYTWGLLCAIVLIGYLAISLMTYDRRRAAGGTTLDKLSALLIVLFVTLTVSNLALTMLACGWGECGAVPMIYNLVVGLG